MRTTAAILGCLAIVSAGCAVSSTTAPSHVPPTASTVEDGLPVEDGTPSPGLPSRRQMERRRQLERVDIEPARRAATKAVASAVGDAGDRAVGWWGDLPEATPYSDLLRPDRTVSGSLSVGTTGRGSVRRAVELPVESPHHSVIERHRERDTQWATEELVDLIRDAAGAVAEEYPGSTLRVGNLGRPGGGDIPWSNSHNSGRDADLAFLSERASSGEPVVTPDLVDFGPDGRGIERPELKFDVERNWALVEALLTHPDVGIQWLFISKSLKKKLLDHARNTDVPPHLVRRASEVLHQPTDAPPHDDHLHVRIACSEQDRLEGCLNYGPRWNWVDWHRRDLLARSLELARAIRNGDPSTQLDALAFLRKIRSPYAPEVALTAGIQSESERVRREALDLATDIAWWSPTAVAEAMDLIDRPETELAAKREAYEILRRSHTRRARRFALSRLLTDSVEPAERVYAARALSHVLEPGLVPVLVDELDDQRREVRIECARVLRRITGHREVEDWEKLGRARTARAVRGWEEWWESHRDESREAWMRRAYARHGFERHEVYTEEAVGELIDLLRETPDHVAYTANRALHRITGRWIPYEGWSYERLHGYWSDWWEAKRERRVANAP